MINILYNIGLIIVMVTLAAVIYLLLIATTMVGAISGISGTIVPIAALGSMIYCFGIVGLRLYNGHY